jgi:hypothetical protein
VTDEPNLSKFQQRLAEKRRLEEERAAKLATPATEGFEEFVPEEPFERSDQDKALDDAIDKIDIVDAYRRFCGKMNPEVRAGQTEGIKISCPIPGHRDNNPSAWINTEKQTWYCGTCTTGGDAMDLAAFHFNYPVPGYKEGAKFHELRRDMAKAYGYTFVKPPGVKTPIPVAPSLPTPPTPVPGQGEPNQGDTPPEMEKADVEEPDPGASVTPIHEDPALDDDPMVFPVLEWQELVEPDTFLDQYMKCTTVDDVPEEYHFWNGLLALGMICGRDVTLYDKVPVHGNLFICLLGNTGDGKSQSYSHLKRLIKTAMPHDWADPNSKGVRMISTPASAEVLIHNFMKPVPDPTDPKKIAFYAPVRGMIEFNELSQLLGRAQRQGNTIKPTLMQFYDAEGEIGTSSMTGGEKKAMEAFASCFTTTQPLALQNLITQDDADSGFLNRWIFASGKQKQRVAIGGVQVDITPCVPYVDNIKGWVGFGKQIQWTDEAAKAFTAFFHSTLQPAKQRDKSGFLTRIDLTLKKLILLFTINQGENEVQLHAVEKAIKMFTYLVDAYGIPAGQVGNSKQWQCVDRIRQIIAKSTHSTGPSLRDIRIGIGKRFEITLVTKMIQAMVDTGEIEPVTETYRGRTSVRYRRVA